MDRNNKQSWCGGCVEVFSMREISKAWGEKRLLPQLRSGYERGDGMRKPEDIKIGGKTLAEVIENHKHWWDEDCEGWRDMRADLRDADLSDTDLSRADLRGADLREAKNVPYIPYACPDFGMFIGFKKASGYIVVLEIPEDAKRLSATGRKCRCSKAKVLEIQNIDGAKANVTKVASGYDSNFVYEVGKTVSVDNFCDDRWQECSPGIHFFINRQEAVNY